MTDNIFKISSYSYPMHRNKPNITYLVILMFVDWQNGQRSDNVLHPLDIQTGKTLKVFDMTGNGDMPFLH